ncbi:S41 family peptidase [Verrucomicrobiota bacterium]
MDNILKSRLYAIVLMFCMTATLQVVSPVVCFAEEQVDSDSAAYDEMERLAEVMLHVKKYYVNEKSYEEIINGALHGILKGLDAHSDFLEPEAFSDIKEDTTGQYSGIGIYIAIKYGFLTIIAPIEDTPGYRAGLQSGDRILKIDGEETRDITQSEAVKKLRGPKGAKVTLTILSIGEEETKEVEIKRDMVEVPTVKGARIIGNDIGYIRITQFSAPTADAFQKGLEKLIDEGMSALVLDLRSNAGGLLRSAIEVSQKLLKEQQLIVSTKGREGVYDKVLSRARGKYHYEDFDVAILINRWSASAAEIVAGALKDNKRAVLVGSTSFGKGSVQSIIKLKSDKESAIRMTTQLYYTPSGKQIHDKGIDPDILVYVSPAEWRKVQIRRAHIENPKHFADEDKEKYQDVVDHELQRAVDLLRALKVIKNQG